MILARIALTLTVTLVSQRGTPQAVHDFRLSPGHAGPFEAGETVEQVYAAVGKDNARLIDLFLEGTFSPALDISLPSDPEGRAALQAEISDWPCGDFAITRIRVKDRRFKTAEGLGVGSTVADLRRAYATESNHEEGEKVIVRTLGMAFATSGDSSDDRSTVWSVILWSDPVAVRAKRCQGVAADPDYGFRNAIPPAKPRDFETIRDAGEWRNPKIIVTKDGVDVLSGSLPGGRKRVPIQNLHAEITALRLPAWPYGRVVMASDNHLRAVDRSDDESIRANHLAVAVLMEALGIRVEWWP